VCGSTTQMAQNSNGATQMAEWHTPIGGPATVACPRAVRQRIVQLSRNTYTGFNHHHLCEKLIEREGFSLSRETLRRLLRKNGLGSPRTHRAPAHRQRRVRSARLGELVQLDAAHAAGSKAAARDSPLWDCRTKPPVKSWSRSSFLPRPLSAISACFAICCAATVSPGSLWRSRRQLRPQRRLLDVATTQPKWRKSRRRFVSDRISFFDAVSSTYLWFSSWVLGQQEDLTKRKRPMI